MSSTPVDLVRSRLEALGRRIVKDRGHEFMAQCPLGDRHAYDDRTPSLHVETGRAGQAVFTCHGAGCTATPNDRDAFVEALGLQWSDLFVNGDGFGISCWGDSTSSETPQRARTYAGGNRQASSVKENVTVEEPLTAGSSGSATNSGVTGSYEDPDRRESEMDELLQMQAAGGIKVPLPDLAPLPADASEAMKRIYELSRRMFGVQRWADRPYEDIILAYRWAAERIGLPERTTWQGLMRLRNAHILEKDKELRIKGQPRPVFTYLPGTGRPPEPSVGIEGVRAPALPAVERAVEPEDAAVIDEREEVHEDAPVFGAVPDDGRERVERDG
jgi:hypothetical protein